MKTEKTEKKPAHTPEHHYGVGSRFFYHDEDRSKPMTGVVQFWAGFSQKSEPVEVPIKVAMAAPDLLAALQDAAAWVDMGLVPPKFKDAQAEDQWKRMIAWHNKARAAIAKAEGR